MTDIAIHCLDALAWLGENARHGTCGAVVTSLPDADELDIDPARYEDWFTLAARRCMAATSPGTPTIFCQTDRKRDGRWLSKPYLLMGAARTWDIPLLWHRIVLRRMPGRTDLHRPGYSHLLAFGSCGPGTGPDTIIGGRPLYANGVGVHAAAYAVEFAARHSDALTDPFCGRGGFLRAAIDSGGFATITGIDVDPAQCEAARATCALL